MVGRWFDSNPLALMMKKIQTQMLAVARTNLGRRLIGFGVIASALAILQGVGRLVFHYDPLTHAGGAIVTSQVILFPMAILAGLLVLGLIAAAGAAVYGLWKLSMAIGDTLTGEL